MDKRHYFLDWVRICAFFILILYHTGMYYVTWDWHIKSPFASTALEPFMMLSSPWRLGLLFFVSGVASAFLLAKSGAGAFLRKRSWRLLLPLVFGMLFVVPPQSYYEVVEKLGYAGGFADFMRLYMGGYAGFCREGDCLDLPTWNHLWFVAYLWVYAMLLGLAAMFAGERIDRWGARLALALAGRRALVVPVAVLLAIRFMLASRFPSTHDLFNDFHNHALYLLLFLGGVLLAKQDAFWANAQALRRIALSAALVAWAYMAVFLVLPDDSVTGQPLEVMRLVWKVAYVVCQWCGLMAACGFARRYVNRDTPLRAYLVHAVFPVYVLHQTFIVTLAHNMKPLGLPPAVEGPLLAGLTLALCIGSYEVIRRIPVLRPLFGAAPLSAPQASRTRAPAAA